MKKCQFCDEQLRDDATFCLYCGKDLNGNLVEGIAVSKKEVRENIPLSNTDPKNRFENLNKKLWAIGLFIFIGFIYLVYSDNLSFLLFICPLSVLIFSLWGLIASSIKKQDDKEKTGKLHQKLKEQHRIIREQYRIIREQTYIPEMAKEIIYHKSSEKSPIRLANSKARVYVWKSEDNISFFPCDPSFINSISIAHIKLYSIPVEQIEYFSKSGDVFRENKITGGGGGGSTIGGAVVGGLIAGEVGAVIASRKKVNEIKSELITHDTRETFLNYFDNGERHSLFFDIDAYQIFNDWIPEKEYNIVNTVKSSEIIKNQIIISSQKSVTDQLRELAKLRDDGIITENEFNEKKKQLLDKIS